MFLEKLRKLREKKGKEKKLLGLISRAILSGHTYVINLYWEEALLHQHVYMAEKASFKPNEGKMKEALENMESSVNEAEYFILKYSLTHWKSRLFRFKGRVFDYKGEFKKSIREYKKAIKFVRKDPEYTEKKVPRWLELEAFLAYAVMMGEDYEKGLAQSKKIYKKFKESAEGKELKRKDYSIWAVWITGIPIRAVDGAMTKGADFNENEFRSWISEAEEILNPPKSTRIWTDFKFRKDEITALKKKI